MFNPNEKISQFVYSERRRQQRAGRAELVKVVHSLVARKTK